MIGRVITNIWRSGLPSADNASDATIARAWCRDRVFAVIATRLQRQQTLAIPENHAIFFMCKGPTLVDQFNNLRTLSGQLSH